MSTQQLVLGDCLDVFRKVRGLGAIVADPPAGIGFMGRSWDKDRGGRASWIAYWAERFAVAREACVESAVALVWALPRTSHWTATALEDGGWFVRDVITHHFGQGWPKNKSALKPASEHWILAVKGKPALDIDACRVERGGEERSGHHGSGSMFYGAGLGHPYEEGDNARLKRTDGSWPTNALLSHAEGCERVGVRKVPGSAPPGRPSAGTKGGDVLTHNPGGAYRGTSHFGETESLPAYRCLVGCDCGASFLALAGGPAPRCACGRVGWWACPVAEMDAQSGTLKSGLIEMHHVPTTDGGAIYGRKAPRRTESFGDEGGASRFFPRFGYYAKAPSGERHAGCEQLYWRAEKSDPFGFVRVTREEWDGLSVAQRSPDGGTAFGRGAEARGAEARAQGNVHPTVKRLALMRWLHALTGAKRIGDLCAGSGSGMVAAYLDGIDWIGAEVCPQAIEIAEARLAFWRGCSPKARARFLADDVMPEPTRSSPLQESLFL